MLSVISCISAVFLKNIVHVDLGIAESLSEQGNVY
jgi:hypothetical protein